MECKVGTGDCKLELRFEPNGDVLEFCTVCNFVYLHKAENIANNYLNPYKTEN